MSWLCRIEVVFVFAAVGLAGHAGAPPKTKFEMTAQEKKLLALINEERKEHELPPLKPNAALFKAARTHSANMAKQQKMDHVLDGKTPFHRIKATGYRYHFAGENIAFGDASMEQIVKAWMKSPAHRGNILHKMFTETGIGIVPDKKGVLYYTQVFGKPLPRQ
jgi:uncharacterized protein YkwD